MIDDNKIIIYDVNDVQRIFKFESKDKAYRFLNAPGVPTMKIGRSLRIYKSSLEKFLAENAGKRIWI